MSDTSFILSLFVGSRNRGPGCACSPQELTQMIHSRVNPSRDRVVFFVDEEKFAAYRRDEPDAAHEPRTRAHDGLVIYGSDRARPGPRNVSSPRRDVSCRTQTTSTCVRPRSSKMWGKVDHPVLASVCQHIACEQARHDRHAGLSPGLRPDRDRRRVVRARIARRMVAQRRMRSRNAQGRHPMR